MEFPEGARKLAGDELQLIRFGGMPRDATSRSAIVRMPTASSWRCNLAEGI